MKHKLSSKDIDFLQSFESCRFDVTMFHHQEHIRLAYILLAQCDFDEARARLKNSLITFLDYNGADKSIYHETMTCAWLLAVRHFMHLSNPSSDSEKFVSKNAILMDKNIMFTHYTRDLMDSDVARQTFVEPDLELIPTHE